MSKGSNFRIIVREAYDSLSSPFINCPILSLVVVGPLMKEVRKERKWKRKSFVTVGEIWLAANVKRRKKTRQPDHGYLRFSSLTSFPLHPPVLLVMFEKGR